MLASDFANNVHDLALIVLVQIGQDLGLAGSAAGGLQACCSQQVAALGFDQVKQVCIQQGLGDRNSNHPSPDIVPAASLKTRALPAPPRPLGRPLGFT
jgi:hypothetical protein